MDVFFLENAPVGIICWYMQNTLICALGCCTAEGEIFEKEHHWKDVHVCSIALATNIRSVSTPFLLSCCIHWPVSIRACHIEHWNVLPVNHIMEENDEIYNSYLPDQRTLVEDLENLDMVNISGTEVQIYDKNSKKISHREALCDIDVQLWMHHWATQMSFVILCMNTSHYFQFFLANTMEYLSDTCCWNWKVCMLKMSVLWIFC